MYVITVTSPDPVKTFWLEVVQIMPISYAKFQHDSQNASGAISEKSWGGGGHQPVNIYLRSDTCFLLFFFA